MSTEKCPPISEFNAVVRYVSKRLCEMLQDVRGNCVAFRAGWLWCDRKPTHMSVVNYIFQHLTEAGYVERIRKRRIGSSYVYIYRLCKSSPLWAAAEAGPDAAYELIVNALDHA